MVDLHTHTDASDGSDSPQELIRKAVSAGVDAIAITDHDTFAGSDAAAPAARECGIDLICGIELSTKHRGKTVHLLGYFVQGSPPEAFRTWLLTLQQKRRERNTRLADRLQSLGLDIRLEEVESLGKTMAGRPHFAKILLQKGYVRSTQEAFDKYIAETGKAFVEREEVDLGEGIGRMREAGGIPVIAHPIRLGITDPDREEIWIAAAESMGVMGLEVMHSDHDQAAAVRYRRLAMRFGLAPTGGSDYHGSYKPEVQLGCGRGGRVQVPLDWLDRQRGLSVHA